MSQALANKVQALEQRCARLEEQLMRLQAAFERMPEHMDQTYQRKRGPKPNGEPAHN